MREFDFRGMKMSEVKQVFIDDVGLTIRLAKRMAHAVLELPDHKRKVTAKVMLKLLGKQEEDKNNTEKQSGKKKSWGFPDFYDEVRLEYMVFLNRDDQKFPKEPQDMTEQEWVEYLVERYFFPKAHAKKVGRSMWHYLRENNYYDKFETKKYPLTPLQIDE